jgi:glycine hydroxymethyltransferase
MPDLRYHDPEIDDLIRKEARRLEETLDLIAAENHAPPAIMETLGSVLNTKTIEGYPGNRYHAGCVHADVVENLAIRRAKELFKAEHVNVQLHSGTSANLAIFFSVLDVGDRVLSMTLSHGGHLSHGHPASVAGKCFHIQHYGVDPDSGLIDYNSLASIARTSRPKMIVAGASSYPRVIDYKIIADVAASIDAYLMVDMAHIGGLVAAGLIPSPVPLADFVSLTCYKTMRGGRGGIILCRKAFARQIDKAVFPGCQGTSPVSSIAAKAVMLKQAMGEDFTVAQKATIDIAQTLAQRFIEKGYHVLTGGTDTHQVLIDVASQGIDGNWAETVLEQAGIILNRNVIPGDEQRPGAVSGIRIGSAAMAARGMGKTEAIIVADLIDRVISQKAAPGVVQSVKMTVSDLCREFPIYRPSQNATGIPVDECKRK